ncbi:MAG: GHKL domain-containing protein [Hespellia sp.]|nr:GHKL domain-containing protein [Hespellia sp.]
MIKEMCSSIIEVMIFLLFNKKIEKRRYYPLRSCFMFIEINVLTKILDVYHVDGIFLRAVINMVFFGICFFFMYKLPLRRLVSRVIAWNCCMIFSELIVTVIVAFGVSGYRLSEILDMPFFWGLILIVSKGCQMILLDLYNKELYFSSIKLNLRTLLFNSFLIVSLLTYLFFALQSYISEKNLKDMIVYIIILTYSFIVIIGYGYICYIKMYKKIQEQNSEVKILNEKAKLQMQYYEELGKYKREIKKIRHDMKNILLVGNNMTPNNRIKYMNEIADVHKNPEEKIISGNEILDILLETKNELCNREEIEFIIKVDYEIEDIIKLVDIGIIFGNIIDNAVESCLKCDISKRKIVLIVTLYNHFLLIKISNPVKEIVEKENRLQTTKADSKQHGIGMLCVKETVEKYDGVLKYNVNKNIFNLTIMIPV